MKGKITFYHSDVSAEDKEKRQRLWSKGDIKVKYNTFFFFFFFSFFKLLILFRLFVQPLLLVWVLINLMFVMLFITQCQNHSQTIIKYIFISILPFRLLSFSLLLLF